jgi:hypothetical protein
MTPQQRLGLIAPVGKEAGRPGGDRGLADGCGFGEDPLGGELVTPAQDVTDTPANRRERKTVGGARYPDPA